MPMHDRRATFAEFEGNDGALSTGQRPVGFADRDATDGTPATDGATSVQPEMLGADADDDVDLEAPTTPRLAKVDASVRAEVAGLLAVIADSEECEGAAGRRIRGNALRAIWRLLE